MFTDISLEEKSNEASIVDARGTTKENAELVQDIVGHLVMFDRDFISEGFLSQTDLNLLFASSDIFT